MTLEETTENVITVVARNLYALAGHHKSDEKFPITHFFLITHASITHKIVYPTARARLRGRRYTEFRF